MINHQTPCPLRVSYQTPLLMRHQRLATAALKISELLQKMEAIVAQFKCSNIIAYACLYLGNRRLSWLLKPPPREAKSWVWRLFKLCDAKEHEDKAGSARCMICSRAIKHKSSASKLQSRLLYTHRDIHDRNKSDVVSTHSE